MSYWGSNEYEKLVGLKVTGLNGSFTTGDTSITFNVEGGKSFELSCSGDCCSSSWFENIELPAFPFPVTIIKVEEVEGPDFTESWVKTRGYDCVQTYGLKMITDKGELYVDMRNDSNGYYGGTFDLNLKGLKLEEKKVEEPKTYSSMNEFTQPLVDEVTDQFSKVVSDSLVYGTGVGVWTLGEFKHFPIERWDELIEIKKLIHKE